MQQRAPVGGPGALDEDELRKQVSGRLRELSGEALRGNFTAPDKKIFMSMLIDAFGSVRKSMNLTPTEDSSLLKLQAQEMRASVIKADMESEKHHPGLLYSSRAFKDFLKTLITDAEDFNKSGLDYFPHLDGSRSELPEDHHRLPEELKKLSELVAAGRVQNMDREYVDDLVQEGLALNQWQTMRLLGRERTIDYNSRVQNAVDVVFRAIDAAAGGR